MKERLRVGLRSSEYAIGIQNKIRRTYETVDSDRSATTYSISFNLH